MMIHSAWFIFAVALFCLAGCDRHANQTTPVSSGARFLALGDSYTIGESVSESARWPVQLAKLLREQKIDIADPEIIATTGWTTDELDAGINRADPRGPYALVTLLIGVNNQYRGRSVDEFRTQFAALLDRAIGLAGGASHHVIVLSIPDWGVTPFAQGQDRAKIAREIDAFNSVCREECERRKAAFIDITQISKRAAEDRSLVAGDGLHPSGKMYRLWAEAALPAAREALPVN
jgi:lysophospholipase L1-like esterase